MENTEKSILDYSIIGIMSCILLVVSIIAHKSFNHFEKFANKHPKVIAFIYLPILILIAGYVERL